MKKSVKHIAVTGGAGMVAYSLLFRIASGEVFGKDQEISLHILEIPSALPILEGVVMELEDSAFPLLKEIHIEVDPLRAFEGADWALLIGAKPRGKGMERKDLLEENGKIFIEQGRALNEAAASDVRVLVLGNPCNTNCLIAMNNAPKIPRRNFHAVVRLDQNRALHQLSRKAKVSPSLIKNMVVWGNHSPTIFPDYFNVKIGGNPVQEAFTDSEWLRRDFVESVQRRGEAIISSRGKSSAASAASAFIDAIRSLIDPSLKGEIFSSGVCSDSNPYGIEGNLIFSFPCKAKGSADYEIVSDVFLNELLLEKIRLSERELIGERKIVLDLLNFTALL